MKHLLREGTHWKGRLGWKDQRKMNFSYVAFLEPFVHPGRDVQ
jgi:hypothetical protein